MPVAAHRPPARRDTAARLVPAPMRAAVLAWYDGHGRSLPFRGTLDPYAVLVSETMAQQTQIARAAERWTAFMARFPTLESLATATPAEVLRAWQGLGYNRRALNLRLAAIRVVEEHGGRLPDELAALDRLPGVGPYTARAVAAIAFGRPVGAVDTNVGRVLGRVAWSGRAAVDGRRLQGLADAIVPADRPADWTHALMDVGATFCRPRRPRCDACPAVAWCRFAARRVPGPRKRPSKAAPARADEAVEFRRTSRWLRGRIVERLRRQRDGRWSRFAGGLPPHSAAAVAGALGALAKEGLVELHPADPRRARLPLA